METSFVIAVGLGVAIVVVILILVAVIVFQRWQIGDKNATLSRFIDENEKMRRKIQQSGII